MSVFHVNSPRGAVQAQTYVWDIGLLEWTEGTQAGGGGGGSGTEYTEDAVTPANPVAPAFSMRRRDALVNETSANGDWVTANGTDLGEQYVHDSTVADNTEAMLSELGILASTVSAEDSGSFTHPAIPVLFVRRDVPVDVASGDGFYQVAQMSQGQLWVRQLKPNNSSQTIVNDNASSVSFLSANPSRMGATITNDSSAILYLILGPAATLTNYTVQLPKNAYYEVPFGYTGDVAGIWATDPNDGAARITEALI